MEERGFIKGRCVEGVRPLLRRVNGSLARVSLARIMATIEILHPRGWVVVATTTFGLEVSRFCFQFLKKS